MCSYRRRLEVATAVGSPEFPSARLFLCIVNLDAEVPDRRLQLGCPSNSCTARRFLVRR